MGKTVKKRTNFISNKLFNDIIRFLLKRTHTGAAGRKPRKEHKGSHRKIGVAPSATYTTNITHPEIIAPKVVQAPYVPELVKLIEDKKPEIIGHLTDKQKMILDAVDSKNGELLLIDVDSGKIESHDKDFVSNFVEDALDTSKENQDLKKKVKNLEKQSASRFSEIVEESIPEGGDIVDMTAQDIEDMKKEEEINARKLLSKLDTQTLRELVNRLNSKISYKGEAINTKLVNNMIDYFVSYPEITDELAPIPNKRNVEEYVVAAVNRAINKMKPDFGEGFIHRKMYGKPLSNLDIDEMILPYRDKGYSGTFALDTIKRVDMPDSGIYSFITNTLPFKSKLIGHWVAVNVTPTTIEYYDPFGHPPEPKMKFALKKLLDEESDRKKKVFKINLVQDQSSNSMNCGWFAIKFLLDRYAGKKFNEASKFANHDIRGERDIKLMQKYYKKFGYL